MTDTGYEGEQAKHSDRPEGSSTSNRDRGSGEEQQKASSSNTHSQRRSSTTTASATSAEKTSANSRQQDDRRRFVAYASQEHHQNQQQEESQRQGNHKKTNRPQSGASSPRKLERSDSSFGSVDISELTGLEEEEKNRSPTPLPTFDNPPKTEQQVGHKYEEKTTARDIHVQMDEQVSERRTSSVMEESAVTMAAVATATRSQSSTAERREVRKSNKEERRSSNNSDKETKETHKENHDNKEYKTEESRVEKSERSEKSSYENSSPKTSHSTKKDRSFKAEEDSEDVTASLLAPRTPEEASTSKAAPGASKSKKSRSRPESSKRRSRDQENNQTIAALDKLADKNLKRLLGNDDSDDEPEVDQKVLDKVFSPQFQAELDDFLRTT